MSPVKGGLSVRTGYGDLKILGTGRRAKIFELGVGGQNPILFPEKNLEMMSEVIQLSRICCLLVAKYINTLFFIRSITLSLNLIFLIFSSFFGYKYF